MKRIAHKSHSFKEADRWDIKQQINMSPQQRLQAAKKLKELYFGKKSVDVREYYEKNKSK